MKILNQLKQSSGVGSLVDLRPYLWNRLMDNTEDHDAYFITVSPNPSTRHECEMMATHGKFKGKMVKIMKPYEMMTHAEQYDMLHFYMEKVYASMLDPKEVLYIAYEINESNNIHCHAIYLPDHDRISQYELQALRKTVYCHFETVNNLMKRSRGRNMKSPTDYMNNIVILTWESFEKRDAAIKYLEKDKSIKFYYPDEWYGDTISLVRWDVENRNNNIFKVLPIEKKILHYEDEGSEDDKSEDNKEEDEDEDMQYWGQP